MADPGAPVRIIVVSINTSWNIINFRRNLIERLRRAGYRIVALSPNDDHAAALAALGVEHVAIDIDNKGLSPLRDLALMVRYWRVLGRIRPDAFLSWTIKPNIYGSLAAQARGIPVINNISGLGTAFIKVGLLTRLVCILYRVALARSATVFFQNADDRRLFIDQGMVTAGQAVLLPGSGIDLVRFAPAAPSEVDGGTRPRFVFLMVARLLRDKGVVEYADAARIVRKARPDVEFRLLGFLDVQNRTAIDRATVDRWERDGVLRYLGSTDDVRQHLAAADAVVLPSYREGLPRSLLEAAAMGRPLIATAVPGCTVIARAGKNALLCPPKNAEALAETMLAMLALDVDALGAMGRQSRAIAEAEFDEGRVAASYLDALGEALAPAGRTSAAG